MLLFILLAYYILTLIYHISWIDTSIYKMAEKERAVVIDNGSGMCKCGFGGS